MVAKPSNSLAMINRVEECATAARAYKIHAKTAMKLERKKVTRNPYRRTAYNTTGVNKELIMEGIAMFNPVQRETGSRPNCFM